MEDDLENVGVTQEQPAAVGKPVGDDKEENKADRTAEKAQVTKILDNIHADLKHHDIAFKRMRRDMRISMHGCEEDWEKDEKYKANITGRHVKQKAASLYAKNPRVVARRRDTLDFAIWDEEPQSIQLAFQTLQSAQQMMSAAPTIDEMGMPVQPQLPPGFEEAQAMIADFQQGIARRKLVKRFARTLELVYAQQQRDQKPTDFKAGMKQVVRRACTTGVGYVELGYQRETGPSSTVSARIKDTRDRMAHLQRLMDEAAEGELHDTDAEMEELRASLEALQKEPEVIIEEGLLVEYPLSTRVIPDKQCTQLMGFVGAEHLTVMYLYTRDRIEEMFGVELGCEFTPYVAGKKTTETGVDYGEDTSVDAAKKGSALVCMYKYFDKISGLVYYVAEGHKYYLKPPAPPEVFVNDFWPVYALTFNAVESETELFPLSDVSLLLDMQREYNRSRQGKREHRQAARPRWVFPTGSMDEQDIEMFKRAEPFEAFAMNIPPGTNVRDVLQTVPVPGVDPNLYDVNEIFSDMQLAVGTQQSQLGGLSKASATETALAANASASGDESSVDDLDTFLSTIARAAGQILMREMSPEQVQKIAGIGAVWTDQIEIDIHEELILEIEAGSSGKPNKAVEVNTMRELLPYLIQMPGIAPTWLARQVLSRMDDRLDLTEAIAEGLPSIVMMNAQKQPGTGDPATDPNAQGGQGANNADKPQDGPSGTGPAFGSNQV